MCFNLFFFILAHSNPGTDVTHSPLTSASAMTSASGPTTYVINDGK